jgi:hypothetical protein
MINKAFLTVAMGFAFVLSLAFLGAPRTVEAQYYQQNSGPCTIVSFTAVPSTINAGSTSALNWATTGCKYAHVSGGSFMSYEYRTANGAASTGELYGTTTFILYAFNEESSTSANTTVYVSGGPYTYLAACTDKVDNDGDGYVDYPADQGCISASDNDEANTIVNNGGSNTYLYTETTPATNVGATSVRLNGIVQSAAAPFNAHFEYGTTTSLGQATALQTELSPATNKVFDTIYTIPETTYYYRIAVRMDDGQIRRGTMQSFKTLAQTPTPVTYVGGSTTTTNTASSAAATPGTPAEVTLTIKNEKDKINVGDIVENTITYTNNTNKTLRNATINVVFPQGFTVKQSTEGMVINSTSVTTTIGTIAPGQTGTMFIQAEVGSNTALNETLVTNATLNYTLPDGKQDSAVGYVINHASVQNVFAGFALGSGFFPSTIFGWLITVIIILIVILIARRIARAKSGHHGAAEAHH